VGVLSAIFASGGTPLEVALNNHFTPISAYSFMIMTLLYMPCIATLITIKSETNWKWAFIAVIYTLSLGWTISTLFFQLANLITSII
ncbi:MAG: ferrous iron transporter B, partial [bacterium]